MPITIDQVYEKIKSIRRMESFIDTPKVIKLIDLFPEAIVGDKLVLDNLNLSRLGPDLTYLDFSNCLITNCKFNYLNITHCIFDTDIFKLNDFDGSYIPEGENQGLTDIPDQLLSESYGREQAWWKWMCENYPHAILKYDKLAEHARSSYCNLNSPIIHDRGFYNYLAGDSFYQEQFGWKLHISVKLSDLKKAFDLAAPIMVSYCKTFKVSIPEELEHQARLRVNAQITIYLETNNKLDLDAKHVRELIEKITAVFKENNISPALSIPLSDTPTFSSYFSLRNDKDVEMKLNYVYAVDAGSNFNPANHFNPYKAILKKEPAPFNIIDHYQRFNRKSRALALDALRLTMVAYLNEYGVEGIFNDKLITKDNILKLIKKYGFSDNEMCDLLIKEEVIKKQYQEDTEIMERIKVALLMVDYLGKLKRESRLEFDNSDFSSLYAKEDNFSKSLKTIEERIHEIPSTTTTNSDVHQYLETEKMRYAEEDRIERARWVTTETGIETTASPSVSQCRDSFFSKAADTPSPEAKDSYFDDIDEFEADALTPRWP